MSCENIKNSLCDSVDDEITSTISQMQSVVKDIVDLTEDPEKLKLYCANNENNIRFILNCGGDKVKNNKKELFQELVSPYVNVTLNNI
tara:strand:+ start:260 stop:523 length:264 start_codon:yes stop_codon:yes gene_type:complete